MRRDLPKAALDVEIYPNFVCICIRVIGTDQRFLFRGKDFDRMQLVEVMQSHTIVTFNGTHFDMLMLALLYYRPELSYMELSIAASNIINMGIRRRDFLSQYDLPKNAMATVDHIDLIEVAFGKASLKLYAGRLHAKKMQDLPYDPNKDLTEEEQDRVVEYCWNDIDNTELLYLDLENQIKLREDMSDQYGVDLRSKSDAQIAEAVIGEELKKITGRYPRRPNISSSTSYKYHPPSFIEFETAKLRDVLQRVVDADFTLNKDGEVVAPPQISMLKVPIGESIYQMGIGGLHSTEKKKTHVSDSKYLYIDKDVTSYYPSIILNNRYTPTHLGEHFLTVYKSIVDRRVQAKHSGDKLTNATLKIVINGSFGKLGSKWSILYSPDLMLQVTITGQLSLMMLIEQLELAGFSVVSANTDGFVTKVDRDRIEQYQAICKEWERKTGFELEESVYKFLRQRDISNYIAMDNNGKIKLKGAYRPAEQNKNPDRDIVSEAVVKYFCEGVTPEETIKACTDIRKFVTVQRVTSGAIKDGEDIGKVIRSYKAKGDFTPIKRAQGGNVSLSYGSKPLMELPDHLPCDVDYAAYIREAWTIIRKDFSDPKDNQLSLL